MHLVVGTGSDVLHEGLAGDDAHRPGERRTLSAVLIGPFLDQTEDVREVGPEFAQCRVIGHDDEFRVDVQDPGCFEEWSRYEGTIGVGRADSVLDQLVDEGVVQAGVEDGGRVLVHGTERVLTTVRARESE